MTALGMARIGAIVGAVYALPVVVWLLPQISGDGADPSALTYAALRALWISGVLALVVFAPSGLTPSLARSLLGVATAIAVSFPVCSLAWLAGAASPGALIAGVGFLAACGASMAVLGDLLRRMHSADVAMVVRAGVQVALAAALWGWHEQWLAWVGA